MLKNKINEFSHIIYLINNLKFSHINRLCVLKYESRNI